MVLSHHNGGPLRLAKDKGTTESAIVESSTVDTYRQLQVDSLIWPCMYILSRTISVRVSCCTNCVQLDHILLKYCVSIRGIGRYAGSRNSADNLHLLHEELASASAYSCLCVMLRSGMLLLYLTGYLDQQRVIDRDNAYTPDTCIDRTW